VERYLLQLHRRGERETLPDGSTTQVYTRHSIRATNATLLLDDGVNIKVMDCWALPPRRSTTSGGDPLPRAPAICWRFETSAGLASLALHTIHEVRHN
jgi:hypothetical protein